MTNKTVPFSIVLISLTHSMVTQKNGNLKIAVQVGHNSVTEITNNIATFTFASLYPSVDFLFLFYAKRETHFSVEKRRKELEDPISSD